MKTGKRIFFSEEKKQRTFNSPRVPSLPAMAGQLEPAQKQKSFASFLQKRRLFLALLLQLPTKEINKLQAHGSDAVSFFSKENGVQPTMNVS
jgi:hypothetical protein